MNWTRANVESEAINRGYEPYQVDGIPEGFSFRTPDITIGETTHDGYYIAFVPKTESVIRSKDTESLLGAYNLAKHGK